MAEKPTELAERQFGILEQAAMSAVAEFEKRGNDNESVAYYNLAAGLVHAARGLKSLAIGLRATYDLLEDVNDKLNAKAASTKARPEDNLGVRNR